MGKIGKISNLSGYDDEFKKFFLSKRRQTYIVLYFIGIVYNPLFTFLDYIVAKPFFWYVFPTRVSVTLSCIPLYIIYKKYPRLIPKIDFLSTLPIFLFATHIALIIYFTGGAISPYALAAIVVFVITGLFVYCTKIESVILTVGFTVMYTGVNLIAPGEFHVAYFATYTSILFVLVFFIFYSLKIRYKLEEENFINQKKIEEKNVQLEKLDQSKTRFFTNLTHEFRTPLVSLSSLLQMIQERITSDPELTKFLHSSQASLNDMLENVNDLLSKTRTEQGFLEIHWSCLDPIQFIGNTVEVFKPLAAEKNLELTFVNQFRSNHLNQNDDLLFFADRFKLKKVLNNLIGNAIKFTKTGGVMVSLQRFKKELILKVRDTGMGIPKEELKTVFEPFAQASNNELRDVKGTGLGLSIVKDFVEAHHGSVELESNVSEGSTFIVRLPLGDEHVDLSKIDMSEVIEDEQNLDNSDIVKTLSQSIEELDVALFSHHKPENALLLLVDDNPQVLQALAYVLKDEYNLYFAKDGQEGIEKVRELKPDLVISDVMMPQKTGYEFLEELRADPELKNTPFVLLTAKVDLESKIKGLEEGADEYISKPFNNLEVKTRVKNLISRKKIEAEFIHSEKMISMGQLVAGISHEILNPIAYAKSAANNIPEFLDAIKTGRLPKEKAEHFLKTAIEDVQDGIVRVCEIAEALKGFMRQGKSGFDYKDVHHGIDSTLKIVQANFKNNLRIHQNYQLDQKVFCNINQLNQVFLNLMVNASQAMESQPEANLWVTTYEQDENAVIEIKDDGPGIPKEIRDKIFNAFFTTKEVGQGTGLGLYISHQIVYDHKGKLSVESTPGNGTKFVIEIPLRGKGGAYDRFSITHQQMDKRLAKVQYPYRG